MPENHERPHRISGTEAEIAEKNALEILTKHFAAVTFEKNHTAMIRLLTTEAYNEVLGPNYSKKRVSERKSHEIRDLLIKKLQQRYSKWINVKMFKIKGPGSISSNTNFSQVFKTPNGMLFRAASKGICKDIFFTSHCLERFEERIDPNLIAPFTEWLAGKIKAKPTTYDILSGLLFVERDFEYAKSKEFWYLNLKVGILVMENFDYIFVVKTFLSPEMAVEKLPWYSPQLTPAMKIDPNPVTWSIKAILNINPIQVKKTTYNLKEVEAAMGKYRHFYRPD